MQESGVNDWESALQIAISLYLDIINLLLEILDAMGNWWPIDKQIKASQTPVHSQINWFVNYL